MSGTSRLRRIAALALSAIVLTPPTSSKAQAPDPGRPSAAPPPAAGCQTSDNLRNPTRRGNRATRRSVRWLDCRELDALGLTTSGPSGLRVRRAGQESRRGLTVGEGDQVVPRPRGRRGPTED